MAASSAPSLTVWLLLVCNASCAARTQLVEANTAPTPALRARSGTDFHCEVTASEACNGGSFTAIARGQIFPNSLAVRGAYLYWTTDPDAPGAVGTVMTASIDGTHVRALATEQRHPCAVAVDENDVYWVDGPSAWPGGGGRTDDAAVMSVALTGGTPRTIVRGPNVSCALGVAGSAEGTASLRLLRRTAVRSSTIYSDDDSNETRLFETDAAGRVIFLGTAGTDLTPSRRRLFDGELARNTLGVYVLANEERVRVTPARKIAFEYGLSITALPPAGGAGTTVVWCASAESGRHIAGGLALDDKNVYWADAGAGAILKMAIRH